MRAYFNDLWDLKNMALDEQGKSEVGAGCHKHVVNKTLQDIVVFRAS